MKKKFNLLKNLCAISLLIGAYVDSVEEAKAQNLTVEDWVDQFIASCVGSGSSNTASGLVEANGDISLRKIALSGKITGQIRLEHKDARLLSEGINNAMSSVAAQQAGEVRVCLAPLRAVLLQVMQQQLNTRNANSNNIYILTPEENSLLRAIANSKGKYGKVGSLVEEPVVKSGTGFGDVRLRATSKSLEDLGFVITIDSTEDALFSLTDNGDDYVLRVGITK